MAVSSPMDIGRGAKGTESEGELAFVSSLMVGEGGEVDSKNLKLKIQEVREFGEFLRVMCP